MKKSITWIAIKQMGGFIIFLILLVIANYLIKYFNIEIYKKTVYFFNENLFLIFLMSFFVMLAEIFWLFDLPLLAAAPFYSSLAGLFILIFSYKFWKFIDVYINSGFILPEKSILFYVFFLILIVGYIIILLRVIETKKEDDKKKKKNKEVVSWKEIGNQFKLAFYNIGKSINKIFEKGKNKSIVN